jgi:hypothetical protein
MGTIINSVLDTYLDAYRKLIAVEPADENSVTISFPFHLAAHHRVEVTVTDLGNRQCIISDAARTLGEVRDAGHSVSTHMKERLERIANLSGLRIVEDHLVMDSSYTDLGPSIQKFLEMCKMIGDVYLVHKQREAAEDDLVAQVRMVLDSKGLLYREREKLRGQIESHPFNLVVPPNGHVGMAVKILTGINTHAIAQIWGYKCDDIKKEQRNQNTRLALIYDTRFERWSTTSRAILETRADVALPSESLGDLVTRLEGQDIVEPSA